MRPLQFCDYHWEYNQTHAHGSVVQRWRKPYREARRLVGTFGQWRVRLVSEALTPNQSESVSPLIKFVRQHGGSSICLVRKSDLVRLHFHSVPCRSGRRRQKRRKRLKCSVVFSNGDNTRRLNRISVFANYRLILPLTSIVINRSVLHKPVSIRIF
jgi:hypothetical protein